MNRRTTARVAAAAATLVAAGILGLGLPSVAQADPPEGDPRGDIKASVPCHVYYADKGNVYIGTIVASVTHKWESIGHGTYKGKAQGSVSLDGFSDMKEGSLVQQHHDNGHWVDMGQAFTWNVQTVPVRLINEMTRTATYQFRQLPQNHRYRVVLKGTTTRQGWPGKSVNCVLNTFWKDDRSE